MNDAAWTTVLRDILRREQRSLLQFIGEAYPWARPGEQDVVAQLQKLIAEEQAAAVRLADFVRRQHIAPLYAGPYPLAFTSLFFVSLDYLLPQLADYERQTVAELQRDLAAFPEGEARRHVEKLLEQKQRHLKTLEQLTAQSAKAAHV